MKAGDLLAVEHTFTDEEVLRFAELTGDVGRHHVETDARGRRMVHGLLTVGLATRIGGTINYILRDAELHFLRPVYTGERVRCEVRIDEVVEEPGRARVATSFVCTNGDGAAVLRGRTDGVVRR